MNIEFRQFQTGESVDALVECMRATFGARGDEASLVERWAHDPNACLYIAAAGEQIVGHGLVQYASDYDPTDNEAIFRARMPSAPRGVVNFNQLSVRKGYRHQGIGRRIANAMWTWSIDTPATLALGVQWAHGGPDHSGHLFQSAGFVQLGTAKGFYRQFHRVSGARCARCSSPECDCSAGWWCRRVPRRRSSLQP